MNRSSWGLAALVVGAGAGAAIALQGSGVVVVLLVVSLGVMFVAGRRPQPNDSRRAEDVVLVRDVRPEPETRDPLLAGLGAATLLTLLVVAADTQGYTGASTNKRWALLVVPVFALLLAAAAGNRSRVDSPTTSDRFLAVYAILGVAGSLVGKLFLGTVDSALVIFVPMCLGLTHLLVRDR